MGVGPTDLALSLQRLVVHRFFVLVILAARRLILYIFRCDAATERKMDNLKVLRMNNGSSQGQNLALTVLCVPNSLVSVPDHRGAVSDERRTPAGCVKQSVHAIYIYIYVSRYR